MSTLMRAKMQVSSVKVNEGTPPSETVAMFPVTSKPFGPEGESEDNTYARYSPSGSLTLTFNNPVLLGKIKVGQKFYLDFTEAAE